MPIINEELVKRANDNSMFNRGTLLEKEAFSEANSFRSKLEHVVKRIGGLNERQNEILLEREAGWRELVASQYNDRASFEANNVSWVVAGPANYNSKRYLKRLDAMENRFSDVEAKKSRYLKNTEDMLMKAMTDEEQVAYWRNGKNSHGEAIAADDPLAVEKMQAHIQYLQEEHDKHVKWNAVIRKEGKADNCDGMRDRMKNDVNETIARSQYRIHKFFWTDNEVADIRSKVMRLEKLKKAREQASQQEQDGNAGDLQKDGLRVHNDFGLARVQLFFEGKPDDDTRAKLKAYGFRWSPRNSAWQRQNTANGLHMARKFFEEFGA